jgi:predicted enzyme related to lactoylglutathione lyase
MSKLVRVILFAKDLDKLVGFYRTGLGLDVVRAEPGFVVLGGDGLELALSQIPEGIAKDIQIANPPKPRENTAIKLVFAVPDVDHTRAQLNAAGARMQEPRSFGARQMCDGVDPEGNVFQISLS